MHPTSWADQSRERGFSDQAHLVREVRRFSGVTPTEARATLTNLYGSLGRDG